MPQVGQPGQLAFMAHALAASAVTLTWTDPGSCWDTLCKRVGLTWFTHCDALWRQPAECIYCAPTARHADSLRQTHGSSFGFPVLPGPLDAENSPRHVRHSRQQALVRTIQPRSLQQTRSPHTQQYISHPNGTPEAAMAWLHTMLCNQPVAPCWASPFYLRAHTCTGRRLRALLYSCWCRRKDK
jgi:hypothetical protein